jgi:formate dehydrogenase major subunit
MTLGTGAATSSFDDIEKAGLIMVVGANPTENHPIVGARIKQAALAGAKLIVIDPRRIELAEYTAIHLPLRAGTNIPLIHAMAHVIVHEKLCDDGFVGGRVGDFEAFRAFIGDWTPERAGPICGVDPQLIRQAARLYATTKPAICFHGLGMAEHTQGTENVACLVNLALLTGNLGKPGTGMNPLRGQNNVQGSAHMGCEPRGLTGLMPIEKGRELFERVWGAPLPTSKGLTLPRMMDAAGEGRLKALWTIGYDVMLTNPSAARTRRSLANLDLLILQDMFMNQMAEYAHVFLPVASSFEKDGTFMNSERRVQRVRKAMEPPGEARPDWQIIQQVAGAMGHVAQFGFDSPAAIWEEIRTVWPAGRGITYERLEQRGLQWPCPDESHPGTGMLHADSFPIGPRAPLQRIDFRPTAEVTDEVYPFLLTTGRRLYQFNAGTMTMRTANNKLQPADRLDIHPDDAARLRIEDGQMVRMRSRHGSASLGARLTTEVSIGQLFATFHTAEVFLNELTSPYRDNHVDTPEYKVTAVCLERV